MILKNVILKNFRSYKEETKIDIGDITTIIGKNDVGKSTILEALDIFFNGNGIIKIEQEDLSIGSEDKNIVIGCTFSDPTNEIIIDSTAKTNLADEFLLNEDGDLEIHKIFNCEKKALSPEPFAVANYPSEDDLKDLLYLNNSNLKKRFDQLKINDNFVNKSSNVSLRKSIYNSFSKIKLGTQLIDLDKEDAKKIWSKLKENLPIYALFQSDRPSRDDDSEVQDPMKLAIDEVIKELEPDFERIKEKIKFRTTEVAAKTIEKLNEMDPSLARELNPNFKSEPKWGSIFKLSLTDDQQVPINKRGSGVRRLILINFFRADAERRQKINNAPGIIYAIEEPETSQHPDNQKMLIEALKILSVSGNSQVILTTHVPSLASLVPVESIRYIRKDRDKNIIETSGDDPNLNDDIYNKVCNTLGVLPDSRVKILICVEGKNDVTFLKNISRILHNNNNSILDLENSKEIAFCPLGGSTLKEWVDCRYLKELNKREVHIYDRDDMVNPPYQPQCDEVNQRNNGDFAVITSKKTIENYLHPDSINRTVGVHVSFTDSDNVVEIVSKTKWEIDNPGKSWDNISDISNRGKGKYKSRIKVILNTETVSNMTKEMIDVMDPTHEIEGWLNTISSKLS
ncbi:MAG TPA: ATP-binding protein [Candidatus Woesebacteria bacterium]|nr:ATP-binding protein [Candidatus Woesebacteria bacterium]